jgi:hypothetical protein
MPVGALLPGGVVVVVVVGVVLVVVGVLDVVVGVVEVVVGVEVVVVVGTTAAGTTVTVSR